eukprot:Ihof_evm4s125 gene=Ihof_evmTU4s125
MTENPVFDDLPLRIACNTPGTFAHQTATKRHPDIIARVLETLSYGLKDKMTPAIQEDLRQLHQCLTHINDSLVRNDLIKQIEDDAPDASQWKGDIESILSLYGNEATYLNVPWLFEECYLYRKIYEVVYRYPSLRGHDLFAFQKHAAWKTAEPTVISLGEWMGRLQSSSMFSETTFGEMIQLSLWGNKLDLSLHQHIDAKVMESGSHDNILINDSKRLFASILKLHKDVEDGMEVRVDIILDNAGYEVLTDLCLADYLICSGIASHVHLHVKDYPWFVSDTTSDDITWLLNQLVASSECSLKELGIRFQSHLQSSSWIVRTNPYWTTWHDYPSMKDQSPSLYEDLQASDLLIFKGDLNYRKLLGD